MRIVIDQTLRNADCRVVLVLLVVSMLKQFAHFMLHSLLLLDTLIVPCILSCCSNVLTLLACFLHVSGTQAAVCWNVSILTGGIT